MKYVLGLRHIKSLWASTYSFNLNNKGLSLVETIVASAVGIIILMISISMIAELARQRKQQEVLGIIHSDQIVLSGVLSNPASGFCDLVSSKNNLPTINVPTLANAKSIQYIEDSKNVAQICDARGDSSGNTTCYERNSYTYESIKYASDPKTGNPALFIEMKPKAKNMIAPKSLKVDMQITATDPADASKKIVSCNFLQSSDVAALVAAVNSTVSSGITQQVCTNLGGVTSGNDCLINNQKLATTLTAMNSSITALCQNLIISGAMPANTNCNNLSTSNLYLWSNAHTQVDCTNAGGTIDLNYNSCVFNPSATSCPAGWNVQYIATTKVSGGSGNVLTCSDSFGNHNTSTPIKYATSCSAGPYTFQNDINNGTYGLPADRNGCGYYTTYTAQPWANNTTLCSPGGIVKVIPTITAISGCF